MAVVIILSVIRRVRQTQIQLLILIQLFNKHNHETVNQERLNINKEILDDAVYSMSGVL